MIGFGWTNPFPLTIGGGQSTVEELRKALLIELSPVFDPDPSTESYAETSGEAALLSLIWAANKRLGRQGNPETMIDNLAVWEETLGIKPTTDKTGPERRRLLAGRMRGQLSNAIVDIEAVCSKIMGTNFVELVSVDPADVRSYWPGVNPGPPGYEWISNYAHLAVKLNTAGLTDAQLQGKVDELWSTMNGLLPTWMTFEIGLGDTFTAAVGILGQTLL